VRVELGRVVHKEVGNPADRRVGRVFTVVDRNEA
jgi:hypothetical protein